MAFRIAILNDLSDYDPVVDTADKLSASYARDLIARAQTTLESDPHGAYKDVREAVNVLTKMSKPRGRELQVRRDAAPEKE
ncbi:MAG: hypothetical protein ACLP5V_12640 [Candidatus Bathyarchaeia archaeon]